MLTVSILTLLLVVCVGVSLGTLGSGGSILLVPILVYVEGLEPPEAITVSLAVVGSASVIGAYLHYRKGHYHWRATLLFASSGSAGALIGATFTDRVPAFTLMLLFGVLMLIVSAYMLWPKVWTARSCKPTRCLAVGLLVGMMTGFLGVGGGFLLVPALVMLGGVPTHSAIGASLAIIAINSSVGLLGQMGIQLEVPLSVVPVLGFALLGMIPATRVAERLSHSVLEWTFALLLASVGIGVTFVSAFQVLF